MGDEGINDFVTVDDIACPHENQGNFPVGVQFHDTCVEAHSSVGILRDKHI